MNADIPHDAEDPNGAKAPGKPGAAEEFVEPKSGAKWAKNPNGPGYGWVDDRGDVAGRSGEFAGDRAGEC